MTFIKEEKYIKCIIFVEFLVVFMLADNYSDTKKNPLNRKKPFMRYFGFCCALRLINSYILISFQEKTECQRFLEVIYV